MKRYFDVYIRQATTAIDLEDIASGVNILEYFDRLELLNAGAKISIEPTNADLGDGTVYVDGETILFECGTLKVNKAEWEYLRANFHNRKCDILFFDPLDNTVLVIAYRVQVNVNLLATSGETFMIRLTGSRTISNPQAVAPVVLLAPGVIEDHGLLSGTVYHEGDPCAGATVTVKESPGEREWADISDGKGKYLLFLPVGEYGIRVTKEGLLFPSYLKKIAVIKDCETVFDCE